MTGEIERVKGLVRHLTTFLVGPLIQYGLDRSPSAGARMANVLDHRFKRLERPPAPVDTHGTEYLVINGIPLAGPRGKVTDVNLKSPAYGGASTVSSDVIGLNKNLINHSPGNHL